MCKISTFYRFLNINKYIWLYNKTNKIETKTRCYLYVHIIAKSQRTTNNGNYRWLLDTRETSIHDLSTNLSDAVVASAADD